MQNFILLDARHIVDNVYGPPNSTRGQQNIDAFRKKGIEKPAPAKPDYLPENEKAYRIDLSGYEAVNEPRNMNGRISFRAVRGKKEFVINEKGTIIGREYDAVSDPQNINGRIAFRAELRGKHFIISENGERIGGKYDVAGIPQNINGRIAFRAGTEKEKVHRQREG